MKKLTSKEYLEDLQDCSAFIYCYTFRSEEDFTTAMNLIENKVTYQDWQESIKYRFTSVAKRSKDFVFMREDGSKRRH